MIRKHLIRLFPVLLLAGSFCRAPGPRKVMTIGDSNGAAAQGWVQQLQNLSVDDSLYNYSIPGNTVGFDNLGKEKLNTLKNIDRYLMDVTKKTTKIDYIVVLLGTNDCKAVFAGKENEIVENMRQLINKIKAYPFPYLPKPTIVLVTPPPYGPDSILLEKYQGGDRRVERLVPLYKSLADDLNCLYVNIYEPLKPKLTEFSNDGVHLSPPGQQIIATLILSTLDNH